MASEPGRTRVLLVDDEVALRDPLGQRLSLRGFEVTGAASGEEALGRIEACRPDAVVLDLKMRGMGGIETLERIRRADRALPVVVLTGHGHLKDALSAVSLGISDFLTKPVGAEQLGACIRGVLSRAEEDRVLRERTIADLMVPPGLYPRVRVDQAVHEVFDLLADSFLKPPDEEARRLGLRSALVYDGEERFLGLVRFSDLLKLALPDFMSDSPSFSYCRGTFVAQCRLIGQRTVREIMGEPVAVDIEAPLMEAVQRMVRHRVISVPVMRGDELAGVLRERDVVLEISREMTASRGLV